MGLTTIQQEVATRLFRIKFIHLVRKGLTAKEISLKLNYAERSVRMRAKLYNLTLKSGHLGRRPKLSNEYIEQEEPQDEVE